jgi:general secretion pathway protein D
MEEVRIVADAENNSLLIWATSQNYERIISTLEKMDISPRQVLIEATFVEVSLTGNLKYGLQWFFNNDIGNDYRGNGSLGLSDTLTLTDALKGVAVNQFSYAITDSGGIVKALLRALATDSKVKVLSSPQVMVLDNQQAAIRVGNSTPIPQGTSTVNNVTTSGGVTYKDTGVLLEVLPRINAGGMVNMEIKQQVSEPGTLVEVGSSGSGAVSARDFLERSVTSKVVIKDGQTLVLGGLIRESGTDDQSGIPVLYKVPVLGALFGQTTQREDRTELIVLITPRVVKDSQEASQVTEEIRRKMQAIELLLPAS